jgi:hypothetical protein
MATKTEARSSIHWRQMVGASFRLQLWRTPWERDFLRTLRDRQTDTLTSEQLRILNQIFERGSR